MKLGYIHVWGKGTANVTEVNLTYGGVTGKPDFSNKENEVSDIRMDVLLLKHLLMGITRTKTELQINCVVNFVIFTFLCVITLNNLPYKSI